MSESMEYNTSTEDFNSGSEISFKNEIKRYNLHKDEFPKEKIPEDIEKLKELRRKIKQMWEDGSIRDITIIELANRQYDRNSPYYADMEHFHNMMNEYETINCNNPQCSGSSLKTFG